LSDDDDERLRKELATEVEGTRTLNEFIAHQDYVGHITKPGIPGQIEKVYRDINSMVDTLGLNSRSLKAFVKGQSEPERTKELSIENLDADDEWCLIEIEDLGVLESSLEKDLEENTMRDFDAKITGCRELQVDLTKIRGRCAELKRSIDLKTDPELVKAAKMAPLSTEQTAVMNDLRRDFTNFQKQLVDTEAGIAMLRAKLASHGGGSSKNGVPQKVPTVEAVERTIRKMTSMAEKKSGDLDVLEIQMRKLNVIGSNVSSREGSPFVTPPTSARKGRRLIRTPGSVDGHGAFFTPKSSRSALGGSIMSSRNGANGTPRKPMDQVADDDVRLYSERARRLLANNKLLREALLQREFRVRELDDV
jgi:nucleoporin NUP159